MKLTNEQRQEATRELSDKLERAIEETPRGISTEEIRQVFENICSLDIRATKQGVNENTVTLQPGTKEHEAAMRRLTLIGLNKDGDIFGDMGSLVLWKAYLEDISIEDQKETRAEFQNRNCNGCFYADAKKVGSGQACCTCIGKIEVLDGQCMRRKVKPGKS